MVNEPILLKFLRKIKIFYTKSGYTDKYVEYSPEDTNILLKKCLEYNKTFLVIKFGTNELENYTTFLSEEKNPSIKDFAYAAKNLKNYSSSLCFNRLCLEAGFFPNIPELGIKWKDLVKEDIKDIDMMVSYLKLEKYISKELKHTKKIHFDGFLKPFLFANPWTQALENKKVLVIHPFADSIKAQYEKREKLFDNPKVLPKFSELHVIKAVQSIANNETEFNTWFEAFEWMKSEIDKIDFDVALIGCGAYGMDLAAYCKRKGKIGLHMASYVQILFGIYGTRWEDDPSVKPFINEYWIRPLESEKPKNFKVVENGCYW